MIELATLNSPSDHKALLWQIQAHSLTKRKPTKIPCKLTADSITNQLLDNAEVTEGVSFIHKLVELKKKFKRKIWKIIRPKPFNNNTLRKKLLNLQNSGDVESVVNRYWCDHWKNIENERYSEFSANAYQSLKKILKYHLFEKRDGGIINCVKLDDNTVVTEPKAVDEQLLKTMEEIQIDDHWEFLEAKEFPKLDLLTQGEVEMILSNLNAGKAIGFDGLSNILFMRNDENNIEGKKGQPSNLEKTALKLRNLWSIPLHDMSDLRETWDTRLVPLNKVFPHIPSRRDMRPIAIQSPLVKILEARFLPKLQDYLNLKLDRSQTGFVQKIGIQVNLVRTMERIKLRTHQNKCTYGLFIDFSNAYNSIPHSLLFQKLRKKKVLEENEIEFLEQLYARYRLRIGKTRIQSNKGVAQGSIISPALFNIFLEDLSEEIQQKAGINFEDLLFYADDLLTLCSSPTQVGTVIKVISEWADKNGMHLNKNKSGIVVFGKRRRKNIPMMMKKYFEEDKKNKTIHAKLIPARNSIEGVPICEKYKYLGTILTPKLTCGEQISYIKRKAGYLLVKLYPYLKNASADGRKDIWQTMVKPLFNSALVLLEYEGSQTQRENLERVWRSTFKQFLLISRRTPNELIDKMINCDLQETASNLVKECKKKWEDRKNFRNLSITKKVGGGINLLRGVSNQWCEIINFQSKCCVKCKDREELCTSLHLKIRHGINIKDLSSIWEDVIIPITLKGQKTPRALLIRKIKRAIEKFVSELANAKMALSS